MGTFREQEGSSGLEGLDMSQEWNTMHGFWLRFAVAGVSTSVWVIIYIRLSMYRITMNVLWEMGAFIALSMVAWLSTGKQLYLDSFYSGVLNSPTEDYTVGKDLPW